MSLFLPEQKMQRQLAGLNVMNNENFQYLGFGENLKTELEKNLKEGKADFQLHYKAEINKKPFWSDNEFPAKDPEKKGADSIIAEGKPPISYR